MSKIPIYTQFIDFYKFFDFDEDVMLIGSSIFVELGLQNA